MTFHPFGFSQTQLAQLGWRSWQPAQPLRPWLECYYLVQPQTGPQSHRLYPDGGSSLILPLPEPEPVDCYFSDSTTPNRSLWRVGEQSLGIRFAPGGFYALFGLSLAELKQESSGWLTKVPALSMLCALLSESALHSVTSALHSVTRALHSVARAPHYAGNAPHYAKALDRFFLQQLQCRAPQIGAVQLWCQAGLQSQQEIRSLLQQQGVGRRTLERQFQQQVGVSPGQLYQWQRLKQARYLLRARPQQALTDIAFSLGYYDQPHFVHQFHQACGQSPGQYRRRKLSQLYKAG